MDFAESFSSATLRTRQKKPEVLRQKSHRERATNRHRDCEKSMETAPRIPGSDGGRCGYRAATTPNDASSALGRKPGWPILAAYAALPPLCSRPISRSAAISGPQPSCAARPSLHVRNPQHLGAYKHHFHRIAPTPHGCCLQRHLVLLASGGSNLGWLRSAHRSASLCCSCCCRW